LLVWLKKGLAVERSICLCLCLWPAQLHKRCRAPEAASSRQPSSHEGKDGYADAWEVVGKLVALYFWEGEGGGGGYHYMG
jgi:hypothetical protein